MEAPPARKWDPNATSMLWAHEIRRENIQLVNQIDNAKADLSSAIDTIDQLKKTTDKLSQRLADKNSNNDKKLDQIGGSLDTAVGRIESLEAENRELRIRLGHMEREYYARAQEWSRVVESVHMLHPPSPEMHMYHTFCNGDGYSNWNGMCGESRSEGRETGTKRTRQQPDILVPDSSVTQNQTGLTRSFSETTWGSSVDLEARGCAEKVADSLANEEGNHDLNIDMLRELAQGEQTLAEYLSHAQKIRSRLYLEKKEGILVETFIRGLNTPIPRNTVEQRMGRARCPWEGLVSIVKEVIEEGKIYTNQPGQTSAMVFPREGAAPAPANDNLAQCLNRKKRRFIPIVPADEEDVLIAASMLQPAIL